jgi:hypothetical protein
VTSGFWRTRRALQEVQQYITLADDAEARLRQLHFQRTDSRNAGGTLAGPVGAALSFGTSESFTEQSLSLPELINDYRDFVGRVVNGLVEAERAAASVTGAKRHEQVAAGPAERDVRLIIGIDAMDQIDDAQKACMFLDELGAVFGTPKCVYLLALSPGTLAAADPRTVPLKTSSSGLFDEMVWVEEFSLQEAADLLDSRVIGMPAAFIALSYVLSGGVPRDLLRVARAIYGAAGEYSASGGGAAHARSCPISLREAADRVIGAEIEALRHRAMASAASLGITATAGWFRKLTTEDWARRASGPADGTPWIQDVLNKVSKPWTGDTASGAAQLDPVATVVCDTFIAGLYFLLTVHDLFTVGDQIVTRLITPGSPARDHDHWLVEYRRSCMTSPSPGRRSPSAPTSPPPASMKPG